MTELSSGWGNVGARATDGFQAPDAWNQRDPSGRGAAPFSVPFGATNAPKNIGMNGDQYIQVLKQFFGEPPKPYGSDPYPRENYDLPDAFVGKNTYLRRIIQRQIQSDELFPIVDCLPWRQNDNSITIYWEQWNFHDHGLDAEPHEGVPRMITSDKQAFSASMTRYGLAFIMEHGFMGTPDGLENYARNIACISNAVKETCAHMAMVSMLSVRPFEDQWAANQTGDLSLAGLEALFMNEISMWACSQKTQWGVELAIGKLRERMNKRGITNATYFIAPEGMMKAASFQNVRMFNFLSGAQGGPKEPNVSGITVRESRPFLTGRGSLPEDPCFTENSIGEFFTMGYAHFNSTTKRRAGGVAIGGVEYRTDLMNIVIYDEPHDEMAEIEFRTAVENCGLWDRSWKITPLGRQYFSRLDARDANGRAKGPFITWANWLLEFDKANVVAEAIVAANVDRLEFQATIATEDAGIGDRAGAVAAQDVRAFDAAEADQNARRAGVQASGRGQWVHRQFDDDEGGDIGDIRLPPSQARADALALITRRFVERTINRQMREDVAALGPRFTNFLDRVRPGLEMCVAAEIDLDSITEAAARNMLEADGAMEEQILQQMGNRDAVTRDIENVFPLLAALELRWTALCDAAKGTQRNPTLFVERMRSRIESTIDMWLYCLARFQTRAESILQTRLSQITQNDITRADLRWFDELFQQLREAVGNLSREVAIGANLEDRLNSVQGVLAVLDHVPLSDGRFVDWCLTNNIPCPIGILLLRLHMTYRAGTGILLVPGGAAGATFMGHMDFQLGDDVTRKMHFGHFTMYAKSLVLENRMLIWARNMYIAGLVGGAGTKFWNYSDDDDNRCGRSAYLNAELNADLIACAVPMHWKPERWHLDATGAYNPALYNPRVREPLHHPGAETYAAYWQWRNNASAAFTQQSPIGSASTPPTANTVAFRGFQMSCNKQTGEINVPTVNKGHWGPNVCIGAAAVRRGEGTTLPVPTYLGQVPNIALQA